MSMFDEVKKALEAVIAPDLQQVKADLKIVDGKLDNTEKLNELRFQQIENHFQQMDRRFDDLIERLDLKHKIEDLQRRVAQQEVKQ